MDLTGFKLACLGMVVTAFSFSAEVNSEPVLGSGSIKRSLWTSAPGFVDQCKKLADQNAEEKCHSQAIRISDYSTASDTTTLPGFTLYSASAWYSCEKQE